MMNKGSLTLIAFLFAIITFGSTVFLSASSERSDSYEIYNRSTVLKSIEPQHLENPVSWMKDLDKIIPPEDRQRIAQTDPQKLNTTERFVQELVFKVLEKENLTDNKTTSLSEININSFENEDFFVEFIKDELQSIIPADELFHKKSLNIQKNASREDIIKYGNTVGEIIKRNSPGVEFDHEIVIFKNLIEKGGRQKEKNLRKIAQGYKNIANEASVVLIPEDVASVHLDFINQIKKVGLLIEKTSFFQQDPLLAILSFNHYLEESDLTVKTIHSIATYFEQKDISYSPDEYGTFFTLPL